jgi:hypothetical protein
MTLVRSAVRIARATELRNLAVDLVALRGALVDAEDGGNALRPFVTTRIIMRRAFYIGAARIADNLNSGFPRGAYDDSVELFTASIACSKGRPILTSAAQATVYEMMGCEASDLESWVEEHE